MIEEWREIKGYEGLYQISSFGRVFSMYQHKILTPKYSRGYAQELLYVNGVGHTVSIHRLVANAFIANPSNLPQINHKDEDKTNNRADNLEWCTAKQNINYGTRPERAREQNHGPVYAVAKSGHRYWFKSRAAASRMLGVSAQGIWGCLHQQQKTAGGFKFELAE